MSDYEYIDNTMRLLISGGSGAGSTSTAKIVGEKLNVDVFDSDFFFHKPTDPPFLEQYSREERRVSLGYALSDKECWILSGSISTWESDDLKLTHGVFLDIPAKIRIPRLQVRQRDQFGTRIDPGGDMQDEHESFLEWAANYDQGSGSTRNRSFDLEFLETQCAQSVIISEALAIEDVVERILGFVGLSRANQRS